MARMCSHTYVHFSLCEDIAVHTHQCGKCQDALYIMFCEDYKVVTQTVEGGCPNHKWRKSADKESDGGDASGKASVSSS